MPIKDIEILSGTLYFNDEPVMKLDKCDLVYEEQEKEVSTNFVTQLKPEKMEITLENVKINRNALLSLLHGRKVTNNWLKIHNGVMTRKKGRKK